MDLLFSNYFILCFIFIILGILLFYFSIKIKEKNSILEALFSLILIASMVSIFSMLLGTVLLGALISFIYIGSVVILFLFCIMMLDLHEKQRVSIITNVKRVFFLKIKEYKKNYLDKYLDNILLFICIFLFSTKLIIYIYFPMRETYYLDEIYQTNKNNFIYSSADTKANDLDNLQLDNYLDPYNYFGFLQNISSIFTDYISWTILIGLCFLLAMIGVIIILTSINLITKKQDLYTQISKIPNNSIYLLKRKNIQLLKKEHYISLLKKKNKKI